MVACKAVESFKFIMQNSQAKLMFKIYRGIFRIPPQLFACYLLLLKNNTWKTIHLNMQISEWVIWNLAKRVIFKLWIGLLTFLLILKNDFEIINSPWCYDRPTTCLVESFTQGNVTSLLRNTYSLALKSDCLFYQLNMKMSCCMSYFVGTSM